MTVTRLPFPDATAVVPPPCGGGVPLLAVPSPTLWRVMGNP